MANDPPALFNNFKEYFNNATFSDVTINCTMENKSFHCHKIILASQSKVFEAMFRYSNNLSNNVDITDIDAKTMEAMLMFLYTGSTPNLEDMAYSLLAAADKYFIHPLKNICEVSIASKITSDSNVVPKATLYAYLHDAKNLKKTAIKLIAKRKINRKTPAWQDIAENHPKIMMEILSDALDSAQEGAVPIEGLVPYTGRWTGLVPHTGRLEL